LLYENDFPQKFNLKELSDDDNVQITTLLKQIEAHRSSSPFKIPVDAAEAPNSYRMIKEPKMCMNERYSVRNNVQNIIKYCFVIAVQTWLG
jgi:hypothetical protein